MSWSLKLFSVNGIPVRVHISFALVVLWAAYVGFTSNRTAWLQSGAYMIAFVLLLFVCVLLHELGHGLVGQLFGAHVVDITLWPIGGLARVTQMPERPYQEFVMTAAGPVTNIVLAIALGVIALVWIGPGELGALAATPWLLRYYLADLSLQSLLLLLIANNALLAVFNLIPAFPLDGGRMLRSALAAMMSHRRATAIASFVGQGLALCLGILALLTGNLFMVMIAVFVFFGAWQEREQTRQRGHLMGLRVRQAMQPIGLRLHPLQTIGAVVAQIAASPQDTFVVEDGGRLAGIMTRRDLLEALRKGGPAGHIGQHMRRATPQLRADDPLTETGDRLLQSAAVVIDDGLVIGTLSRSDVARLSEALNAHPEAVPRDEGS